MLKPVLLSVTLAVAVGCSQPAKGVKNNQQIVTIPQQIRDTVHKIVTPAVTSSVTADSLYRQQVLFYKDIINKNTYSFRKVVKDLEVSPEGGEAVFYLSHGDTVKIRSAFYGETGKALYEFYIKAGIPVFCMCTTIRYTAPISPYRPAKTASATVDNIIMRNNTIVSWLKDGKQMQSGYVEKAGDITTVYKDIQSQ